MLKIPEPKTKHKHESTWDDHSSRRWTYFVDEVKQRIKFFLSKRLHGKNIDIGGGWHLLYPNSTVVDLSSLALQQNPAKEKLQFDLDTIAEGANLPYEDNSFDSATFISVFQYIKHPKTVVKELERILCPGAEMYLINGQGAGLDECIVGGTKTEEVQRFFENLGYDTLVEHIPSMNGSLHDFMSVCVAMPGVDLNGETLPRIENKKYRMRKDEKICQDSSIFLDEYRNWELNKQVERLEKLSTYPVTKDSIEYLERVEKFSQEYHQKTGDIPLMFIEHGFEPELAMYTPGKFLHALLFLMLEKESADKYKEAKALLEKHKISIGQYINYFDKPRSELLEYCSNFNLKEMDRNGILKVNESDLRKFANFISAISLNSFTTKLQEEMYERLNPRINDFDKWIKRQKAFGYHMATYERKNERRIDELIAIKDELEAVEIRTLDYKPLVCAMEQFIK